MKILWITSISPPTVATVMPPDVSDGCNSLIRWLKVRAVTRCRSLCRVLSEQGMAITTGPRSERRPRLSRSEISPLLDWPASIGRSSEAESASGSHPMRTGLNCVSQRAF
jgi:hypothetical protein